MSIWIGVVILLALVGLIVGNMMLLKFTSKRPLPKITKDNNAHYDKDEDNW